jgi:hypothetical protein
VDSAMTTTNVIPNAVRNLKLPARRIPEILRCAQNDNV